MRLTIAPRTRWGRIRVLLIASILPVFFLLIWLFTIKMPGPSFSGPLPPLTPNQAQPRDELKRHVTALAHDIGVRSDEEYANVGRRVGSLVILERGNSAIMITDTAPYRNPFYHPPQDTPDQLDYDRMARVVHGLTHVVRAIANPDR